MKRYIVLGEIIVAALGAALLYYLLFLYFSTNPLLSLLVSLVEIVSASALGIGLEGSPANYAFVLAALAFAKTVVTILKEGKCRSILLIVFAIYILATATHSPLMMVPWLGEPLANLTVSSEMYTAVHALYTGLALVVTYVTAVQLEELYQVLAGLEEEGFPRSELGRALAASLSTTAVLLVVSFSITVVLWTTQLQIGLGVPEYYLVAAAILLALAGAVTYLYVNPYITVRRMLKKLQYNLEDFYRTVTLKERVPATHLSRHVSAIEQYVKHTYTHTHRLKHIEILRARNGTALVIIVESPRDKVAVEAWVIYEPEDERYRVTLAVRKPEKHPKKLWIQYASRILIQLTKVAEQAALEIAQEQKAIDVRAMYDELQMYYTLNVIGGPQALEKEIQKLVKEGMSREEAIATLYKKRIAK